MNFEVARKAIDFFMEKVPQDKEAAFIFFGGEPILSYDIIEKSCEYINKYYLDRITSFHITTNGTLLNHKMIDYMSKRKFGITISIDGGREIHNRQRPLLNGKDSFDMIMENIDYLLKKNNNVVARGTYCDFNYDLCKCYQELINIGFQEVNVVPDFLDIDSDAQMEKLLFQLDNFHKFVVGYCKKHSDFPFGLLTSQIRKLFLPAGSNFDNCGVGRIVFAIDYKGDIYPCHRYSGEERYRIGSVVKQSYHDWIPNNEKGNMCVKCWNRYTCSHGCMYEKVYNNKNKYICKYAQKMTEISIALCKELNKNTLDKILLG